MRITFLMPGYMWGPSGGYKVVYEYANQLVSRGHRVSIAHPRRLKFLPPEKLSFRARLRKAKYGLIELCRTPVIDWHFVDKKVEMLFVPDSSDRHLPDADILFATAWQTVPSILRSSKTKGERFYLIQGYETWMGPKALVDQTWLEPINKVVISRWLLELGNSMGATNLTHIPMGLDHRRYRVLRPIPQRSRQVVMALSWVSIKGSHDGIKALEIAKRSFPDLRVALFGNSRRPPWVPKWMMYAENPQQTCIVEEFYNGSSIVLSPSLAEGFGLPPAEAAACGCAIVATDIKGHREHVQDSFTGLLSPPEHPEALAHNLCRLLADDDLRIRLARAANDFIKQFTWERSTDLLETLISHAVDGESVSRLRVSAVEARPAWAVPLHMEKSNAARES
jgi:glycosyltransferase involved in cell wall biosynthesis